jgi:hypothetical protein
MRRSLRYFCGGNRRHADARAVGQEFFGGVGISAARARVADGGCEEFEEAHRGALNGGGDQPRQRRQADWNELVHPGTTFATRCSANWQPPADCDAKKPTIWRLLRSRITGTYDHT